MIMVAGRKAPPDRILRFLSTSAFPSSDERVLAIDGNFVPEYQSKTHTELNMSLMIPALSIGSSAVFLSLLPFRLSRLRTESIKVIPEYRGHFKLVCIAEINGHRLHRN